MSDPAPSNTADVATAPRTELLLEVPPAGVETDALVRWIGRLVAEVAPGDSTVVVRLTDDSTVASLNEQYRRKHGPTDVLSFPGTVTPEGHHLGDIVIAVPTAVRQAEEAGHTLESELRTLLLHGVLHCLGYDHETDDGEMERIEDDLREQWVTSDE